MEKFEIGEGASLYFARPDGREPLPTLVWIHGGGWQGGSASQFFRHMEYVVSLGMASASVEYRLSSETVRVEDCLADCACAVKYLRLHAAELGVDPRRIAVGGDSSGGHLACCLGEARIAPDPMTRADAVLNLNGVVDLTMKFKNHLYSEAECADFSDDKAWLARYEREEAISPLYQVAPGDAPTLNVQGLCDPVVLPEEILRYHRAQVAAGIESELWLLPNITHAFILFDYHLANERVQEILERVCGWTARVLSGSEE